MKRPLGIFCVTVLAATSFAGPAASQTAGPQAAPPQTAASSTGPVTDQERAALVEQLVKTRQELIESIRNLSDAQWRFKPSPFKWSIAECADHIILSEDFLFGIEQRIMKTPAGSRPAGPLPDQDKALQNTVADRSHKVFNPDAIAPTGRYATPAEAIAEFTSRRSHTIEYAKTTKDDLRAHFVPAFGSTMDAYQFLLLISAHSGRHTAQIREVKADSKYPGQ